MSDAKTPREEIPLWQYCLFLGASVSFLYILTNYDAAFVLDDTRYLTGNPAIRSFHPLSPGSWRHVVTEPPTHYRPLPLLLFAWEWFLGNGSPVFFHIAGDLLHAVATVLL
ncbi:MAG: hypothetical protein AB1405_05555, partial [Bdellovibrionota bacterium]